MLCFRMHPHHHGSGSLQTQTASLPVVVDTNPAGGWDYLATPSCQRLQPLFQPQFEVIMHMQVRSFCSSHMQGPKTVYSIGVKESVPHAERGMSFPHGSLGMDNLCGQAIVQAFRMHVQRMPFTVNREKSHCRFYQTIQRLMRNGVCADFHDGRQRQ